MVAGCYKRGDLSGVSHFYCVTRFKILFIVSEVCLFFSFLGAFFHSSLLLLLYTLCI